MWLPFTNVAQGDQGVCCLVNLDSINPAILTRPQQPWFSNDPSLLCTAANGSDKLFYCGGGGGGVGESSTKYPPLLE